MRVTIVAVVGAFFNAIIAQPNYHLRLPLTHYYPLVV